MNFASVSDSTPYILLLVGLAMALFPLLSKNRGKRLADIGLRSEGIIFKLDRQPTGNMQDDDSMTKNKITVRFVTQTKEWITADLNTNGVFLYPGQFKEGQMVSVRYDPANPTDFTLEDLRGQRLGGMLFLVIGILLLAAGCYLLLGGAAVIHFKS
jgi:hypothetical protein